MRVSRTGTWDNEQPRSPDAKRLFAQYWLWPRRIDGTSERPISHHPLETSDAGLERFKFGRQFVRAGGELLGDDLVRAGGWPFYDVGETDPVIQQHCVVEWFQALDAQGTAGRHTENGPRERRPETVRFA